MKYGMLIFLLIGGVVADTQTTHCVGYQAVRTAVAAADTDPNATQRTYAYYAANLTDKSYRPKFDDIAQITFANYINLLFTFNDSSATGTVKVFAIRNPAGIIKPLEPVCVYTLTAGAQQTDDATARYFADQAVEVSNPWNCKIIDYGGTDGGLKIEFDGRGYYAFIVLFTTISADDTVSAYAAYY